MLVPDTSSSPPDRTKHRGIPIVGADDDRREVQAAIDVMVTTPTGRTVARDLARRQVSIAVIPEDTYRRESPGSGGSFGNNEIRLPRQYLDSEVWTASKLVHEGQHARNEGVSTELWKQRRGEFGDDSRAEAIVAALAGNADETSAFRAQGRFLLELKAAAPKASRGSYDALIEWADLPSVRGARLLGWNDTFRNVARIEPYRWADADPHIEGWLRSHRGDRDKFPVGTSKLSHGGYWTTYPWDLDGLR